MKKVSLIIYLITFIVINIKAGISNDIRVNETESQKCNFFLIKDVGNEVVIERVSLTEGELKVFKTEALLSYIMVFPAGSKSGEIIEKSNRINGITALYSNGIIKISIIRKDGLQKSMPDIDLELARKTNVRLNITGSNGYEKAFIVERFESVKEDDGPVLDIFSGQIPLKQGDYSFFIECMEAKSSKSIVGVVPYLLHRGWITVNCKLSDGTVGRFVVDFGATTTLIPKNMLPPGNEILKLQMVEHSSEGVNISKAVSEGASGKVENIGGVTVIKEFQVGNLTLNDLKVTVLDDFPKPFIDAGIDGVIGRDVLLKASYVEITNLDNENALQELHFKSLLNNKDLPDYKISFNIAGGGNIYFKGKIKNIPVDFFFDSGSGSSIVNKKFLDDNEIEYTLSEQDKKTSYGIDGKGTDYHEIKLFGIQVGDISIENMICNMSDLNVLQSFGMKENTCLLGMDFLSEYSKVIFDFNEKAMLLWE